MRTDTQTGNEIILYHLKKNKEIVSMVGRIENLDSEKPPYKFVSILGDSYICSDKPGEIYRSSVWFYKNSQKYTELGVMKLFFIEEAKKYKKKIAEIKLLNEQLIKMRKKILNKEFGVPKE